MLPICVNTLTSGGFATAREAAQHLHNDEVIQGRKDLAAELDVWPPDAKLLKDTIFGPYSSARDGMNEGRSRSIPEVHPELL